MRMAGEDDDLSPALGTFWFPDVFRTSPVVPSYAPRIKGPYSLITTNIENPLYQPSLSALRQS
jgi:hypothetical protein